MSKRFKKTKRIVAYTLALSLAFAANTVLPAAAADGLTPYGSYRLFDFESTAPDHSTWNGTIDLRFVKNDSVLTAHTGTGAMYVNSDGGQFSAWGGPTSADGNMPKAGDKVGGYFYYKRVSEKEGEDWKLPRVRIFSEAAGNNEAGWLAVTKDIETANNRIAPVGEWVKVELESTGRLVSEADVGHLGYNITCDGVGNEFMIDDIVFGAVTESETDPDDPVTTDTPDTPGTSANTTVVPVFDEYIGSTINGDFEVGNDTVGNQYWGTYPDGMMTLITKPETTICKTAVSGKNVICIKDTQTFNSAWNLFNFAENETDTLPHLGDKVGGSFWLFVPQNADLTKNIPYVTFGYQHTTNGDTDIATSEWYDKSKLVKGQWNEIPIMPMENGAIEDVNPAKYAGIFVKAVDTDKNVDYFIDKIRVGKLVEGMYFSDASALTKEIEDSDETVDARIVIQNSKSDTDINAKAYVAAYDEQKLVGVQISDITVAARGKTGVSVSETEVKGINIKGVDRNKLKIKAFLLDEMTPLTTVRSLYYMTKKVDPGDKNIKYIGRWKDTGSTYRSSYIRPYFKTNFTGTSIAVEFGKPTSLQVTIDGKTSMYSTVEGRVTLAENLASREHSIRVASVDYSETLEIKGIYVDVDAELKAPELNSTHIEFIGDSITAWNNGYSWQVGEALGVEHSRVAWPGLALTDGFGYTGCQPLYGLSSAYFKLGLSGVQDITDPVPDWNFSTSPYTPDIAVINIGTNDAESVWWQPNNFTNTYSAFIDNVRAKLPDAEIFVMRAVSIPHAEVLNPAVETMVKGKMASDAKLHYIDTTDWGVSINPQDNVHPDVAGHTTITNHLCEILSPYIDGNTSSPVSTKAPTSAPTGAPTSAPTAAPTTAPQAEALDVYGCWNNLKFDTGAKPANVDTYPSDGTVISYTGSDAAHTGNGAVMFDGTSSASMWGVRVNGEPIPQTGDTVAGYFWIKLLSTASALPNVKMVKDNDFNTIFASTESMTASEIAALPLNTWVKINIKSTGTTYTSNETSAFVIEVPSGVKCVIDDVTFGKAAASTADPTPTPGTGDDDIVENGMRKVAPDNINIRYIGRWSGDSESFESGWVRPYIKLKFTGNNLKMDLLEATNLQVVIDGQQVYGNFGSEFSTVNGQITIASGLSDGVHEARISTIDLYKRIKYSGFWVDEDATLSQPTTYETHIEFIGDSITSANDGYAWTAGEALQVEHTRISWPGISLTDGRGYTGFYPYYGMESAYDFVTLPGSQSTTAGIGTLWDFDRSQYTPDIFVINLGTNDSAQITGNSDAISGFENSYKNLISELRSRYPSAEIFALKGVSIPNSDVDAAITRAIKAAEAADSKVHYVDTSTWGVEISGDGIHPTMSGYNQMSAKLVERLAPYVVKGVETVTPLSVPGTIESPPYEATDIDITPYGCFNSLGFESGQPANTGVAGGEISFVSDLAHTGSGSMKINVPENYFSSHWGNAAYNEPMPSSGDRVAGYFWIYLLDTPSALPVVKMVDAYNMQSVIYCQTDTNVDLSKLPLRTWIKINVLSTGTAYNAEWPAFSVETQSGFNGYVDDIVFGKENI